MIGGPTAAKKTKLAFEIQTKVPSIIINADSMQVYNELRTLTNVPSKREIEKYACHLFEFVNYPEKCNVGFWFKNVLRILSETKGKIPIFVGGTGLYFKALTDGLVSIPNIPIRFRNKIRTLHKNLGQKKFYQKLIKLDPYSKKNINPTDTQRSIRAYEVKQFTKKSLNDWFKNTKSYFDKDDFFKIYIDYPREDLIQRISKRAEQMIEMGAVNEVKRFLKLKVRKDKSVNKAIGINEIKEYLEKRKDMLDVIEKISIKTRQNAKRKSTRDKRNMISKLKLSPQDLKKFIKKN